MKNRRQQQYPIISGLGFPGQRETRRVDERSEFRLIFRQWAGTIVLTVLSFLLVVANIFIIGPLVGYIAGIVASVVVYTYLRWLTYREREPIPTIATIIGLLILGSWVIAGYQVTELFWWDIRCEWEPRNKLLFVVFSGLFLLCTSLPIWRFAQEIVDPNWSPTIQIRPAEWGIMWPWFRPPADEPELDNFDMYSTPRQTPIDEIDERYRNGSPKLAQLTWLPIAPDETQRLAVAVVVEGVRFVRADLVKAKAILLNDYTGIKNALLERNYLRRSGNGVSLTFAGYRWFCTKVPDDMTPLPYTSLNTNGKTNG